MGRWSRVAAFPVSERMVGGGEGAMEAILAMRGLALQGLPPHLGPSAPGGPAGTQATQSGFCFPVSVLELQKWRPPSYHVISSSPRRLPRAGRRLPLLQLDRGPSQGAWCQARLLHGQERSWPEKLPPNQSLCELGRAQALT